MTTPNLPWATTTDSDLPQGVVSPGDLGVRLQQHGKADYTNIVASRIPGVAQSTAAGSARSGPFGFIVGLFSQVTSNVATADPADINGPDDIVARAGNFFGGLPLVSFIGDIVGAITGIVGGGFNTLATFFSQAFDALQGFAVFGPISNIISGLFGHQVAVNNSILSISDAQVQANTRLDALESFEGSGVTTPLWGSVGGKDIYTFPDTLMTTVAYEDTRPGTATGFGGTTTPQQHTHPQTSTSSTKRTYAPSFTPGKGGVDIGFARGGLDQGTALEMFRIITGSYTNIFDIDAWYLGIYAHDIPNNRLAKIWDSGNIKNVLTSQRQRYNIATSLTAVAQPDQLLGYATLQVAPGFVQTPRGIGCIAQTGIYEPPGVFPQAREAYWNQTASSLPQYIPTSELVWDRDKLLWASAGPVS